MYYYMHVGISKIFYSTQKIVFLMHLRKIKNTQSTHNVGQAANQTPNIRNICFHYFNLKMELVRNNCQPNWHRIGFGNRFLQR